MFDPIAFHDLHPLWIWLAIAAALLAVEVATGSGWLLWPAASAAAVGVMLKVVDLPLAGALMAFALLTIASTLLARRYFPRREEASGGDINDGAGRLPGQRGRAVADFTGGAGRVFVDGKEWAADSIDGAAIAAGAPIEVVGVSGAKLSVRPT